MAKKNCDRRAHDTNYRAEHSTGDKSYFPRAADECVIRAAAHRKYLWSVWNGRTQTVRGDPRGNLRRDPHSLNKMVGVRPALQAGRSRPPPLHNLPISTPSRLADLVCRDAGYQHESMACEICDKTFKRRADRE